jgi:hypothetical protein
MGDPAFRVLFKVEGDDRDFWVPEENQGRFLERMQGSGLRVTRPQTKGPLAKHYGPERPDLEDEAPPAGERPLPRDWGVDTTAPLNQYGVPSKLLVRPVPDKPSFPPKDPALAASDKAAVTDAIAHGRNFADVPARGGASVASGTGESLPGGVPDEEPGAEFGAPASDMDANAGMGESEDDPLAASREALAASRAMESQDQGLRNEARTVGRGVDSPQVPSMGETAWRSPVDLYSLGFDDTMAGIGAMGDEFARSTGLGGLAARYLDPVLRLGGYGADIPMRVDRQVMGEGRKLQRDAGGEVARDADGNPVREPGQVETQSQMAYSAPPQSESATVAMREPAQHNFQQGKHGVPMTAFDTYLNAGADESQEYERSNQEAFEANPGTRFAMGVFTGAPLAVLARRLGSRTTGTAEADAATARAGPQGDWVSRAAAGAVDATTKPGNIGYALTSGAGHAKGERPLELAADAAWQAAGEMAVNAIGSAPAEIALELPRAAGRSVTRKLRSLQRNPLGAQTVRTAMDQGGTQFETFRKPEGFFWDPLTSERGVRGGPVVREAEAESLMRGSAQPAEDLRERASNQVTKGLENQRSTETQWIHDEKQDVFQKEGKAPVDEKGLMAEFGEEMPPSAQARGRAYVQSRLRRFGPPPQPPPQPQWSFPGQPPPPPTVQPKNTPQIEGVDARDLDDMIRVTSDRGKEFKGEDPNNEAFEWQKIAEALRRVRDRHYPRLRAIDDKASQKLSEFEANASGMGINQNVSPVDTTAGSAHSLSAYERLEQAQGKPPIRSALDRLKPWNPEAAATMDRSRGIAATQRLIAEAKQGGPAAVARARVIGGSPPRASVGFPDISPGMRAAGMQNLGLNSNAVLREAMSKAVTPEDLAYVYALLGKRIAEPSEPQKVE